MDIETSRCPATICGIYCRLFFHSVGLFYISYTGQDQNTIWETIFPYLWHNIRIGKGNPLLGDVIVVTFPKSSVRLYVVSACCL
jgi:hypothetical protein